MFNFQGTSQKQIQTIAVKVLSSPRIKIGVTAKELLGMTEEHNLFIDKDLTTNKIWMAAIPVVKNEEGKTISMGRPVNKDGQFGHAGTNHLLGGQHSEWEIDAESKVTNEGVDYYSLVQTVDGSIKRAELAAKAKLEAENAVEAESTESNEAEDRAAMLASMDEEEAAAEGEAMHAMQDEPEEQEAPQEQEEEQEEA